MPPARRKGYTYLEQPAAGTADATWAVVRDADGQGLGAFATNRELYDAIDADRAAAGGPPDAAFRRTHLDERGPDLRMDPTDELVPDGSRRQQP